MKRRPVPQGMDQAGRDGVEKAALSCLFILGCLALCSATRSSPFRAYPYVTTKMRSVEMRIVLEQSHARAEGNATLPHHKVGDFLEDYCLLHWVLHGESFEKPSYPFPTFKLLVPVRVMLIICRGPRPRL